MERQIDLQEISDGKLYRAGDLVKADCGGCIGCSACCRGMGSSILLDPLDCMRISRAAGTDFYGLLSAYIELHVVDGLILPNLRMAEQTDACVFLSGEGRCRIHDSRPGFCRLFPLGRYYHDRTFSYFLQVHECKKEVRSKVKVKKWLEIPDIRAYEQYICDWHYFLKDAQRMLEREADEGIRKRITMAVLQNCYVEPYQGEDSFYREFSQRLKRLESLVYGTENEKGDHDDESEEAGRSGY